MDEPYSDPVLGCEPSCGTSPFVGRLQSLLPFRSQSPNHQHFLFPALEPMTSASPYVTCFSSLSGPQRYLPSFKVHIAIILATISM